MYFLVIPIFDNLEVLVQRLGFLTGIILAAGLSVACGDPIERRELNRYRTENRYVDKQELAAQTAFLVLEIDGKLKYDYKGDLEEGAYASGFLISRNRGLFKTAYHFSRHIGENGVNWCRLFINGRVYRAGLYRASSSLDSAVIKILDEFNESDFPEVPPFASIPAKVGDKVSVEGYHPHPYVVRMQDLESGKKFQLIPLLKNYYQTVRVDTEDYTEIVYEVLEAEVIAVDQVRKFGEMDDLAEGIHRFFMIRTKDNHFFSFRGLSGTVIKNQQGEVLGEVTGGPDGMAEDRIIIATPSEAVINEIKDLLDNYNQ